MRQQTEDRRRDGAVGRSDAIAGGPDLKPHAAERLREKGRGQCG
jgi:hypothetical protein